MSDGGLPLTADCLSDKDSEFHIQCIVCNSPDACDILSTCLHSVCKRCTSSLKSEELDGAYVCTCKEISSELINNPILSKFEGLLKSPNCTWCEDNGEHTKSIGNCKECDVWLCGECLKGHNRMPPLRNHTVNLLPKTASQDTLRCEAHPHEALECFCEACGILTCRDCQLSVHRDHGSHRWVGEKANLLQSPLEDAIARLEEQHQRLSDSCNLAIEATKCKETDSFLGSIEKTRSDIQARTDSLVQRIRSRADVLLQELQTQSEESVKQLEATEILMKQVQDQMKFCLAFATRLIKNKDTDPVSLVQLFSAVTRRLDTLQSRSERLSNDSPPAADAVESKHEHHPTDLGAWRKPTLGWRTTVNTRALFFATWDPEELSRHSGTIAWLPKQNISNILVDGHCESANLKVEANEGKDDCKSSVTLDEEYGDFLGSLAALDGPEKVSEKEDKDQFVPGVGCAVCFGTGLLAHCGKCRRAYHLDCHLPRLTNTSLIPGWVCGLCANQDAASVAHVEPLDENCLPHTDYLVGCRILLGLLVNAEAVHFTASVCPACSVPLLIPGRIVPPCPAGHLYHRLAELRLQLEEAASHPIVNGSSTEIEENIGTKNDEGHSVNGRARLTRLDDWLAEIDKFWSEAGNLDSPMPGTTKGCLQAARRLRASLASLIRIHRPQSQLALSAMCCDDSLEEPVDQKMSVVPDATCCEEDNVITMKSACEA